MTTATLALFDLAALTPSKPRTCGWCKKRPVSTRVYAIQNLYGVHATGPMPDAWYRHAGRRAVAACCDRCADYVAASWWNPTYACPQRGGSCHLWTHTWTDPHPRWNCKRHHREHQVVWSAPLAVAS